MPNYRRLFIPGGTYFFTLNLEHRNQNLLTDSIGALRTSWAEVNRAHPFETVAVAVLPDHMHFVWRLPQDDHDFAMRIRLLKAGFTRRLAESAKSLGRKGERRVWQRRFWEHAIRDAADLDAHINYVHFNPVRHGYVAEPGDWAFSSWRSWVKRVGSPGEAAGSHMTGFDHGER